MSADNNIKKALPEIRRSSHNPIIGKGKCMNPKCKKQSELLVYVLVGPNLDIKSLRGCFCEPHGTAEVEELSVFRETRMERIDDINKRTEELKKK